MSKKTALFVVEGERLEFKFFSSFARAFNLDFDICAVRANIYNVYILT